MKKTYLIIVLSILFLSGCKKEPPVASFSYTPLEPEIGETVVFSNTTTLGNSFSWDFGDGTTSNVENPSHTFTEAGNFPVELTAVNEDGSDSHMQGVPVVPPPPVADFTMDKSMVIPGEVISFTNSSQWGDSYSWDFGDGSTSTVTDPTHSYNSEGLYTVTLTATGHNDQSDSYSLAVNVCYPPEADFIMDRDEVCAGETVQFTNQSTEATSYLWDFGDGSTSTDTDPDNTWATGGVYTVQLTASGNCGSDVYSDEVTVHEVNIFPGVGIMTIEVGDTWVSVEADMPEDTEYLGYTVDGSGYISHVYESETWDVIVFLVSPSASYTPSDDDILWLMGMEEDYVGATAECIRMGSLLSEVVGAYGDPDRIDDSYDSYFYDILGVRFYFCCSGTFDSSDIVDMMTVFPGDAKKSTGMELPSIDDLDIRNIRSKIRKQ